MILVHLSCERTRLLSTLERVFCLISAFLRVRVSVSGVYDCGVVVGVVFICFNFLYGVVFIFFVLYCFVFFQCSYSWSLSCPGPWTHPYPLQVTLSLAHALVLFSSMLIMPMPMPSPSFPLPCLCSLMSSPFLSPSPSFSLPYPWPRPHPTSHAFDITRSSSPHPYHSSHPSVCPLLSPRPCLAPPDLPWNSHITRELELTPLSHTPPTYPHITHTDILTTLTRHSHTHTPPTYSHTAPTSVTRSHNTCAHTHHSCTHASTHHTNCMSHRSPKIVINTQFGIWEGLNPMYR